ncbi:MAG: T9SS type A sorting domain-containing protein [Draconibacterium sp.]|nr:T9SS type A sorting domain-containing protein [Draconibacterium sp.]
MKKILLSVSIILMSLSSFSQYGMRAVNWPIIEDGVTMVADTIIFSEGATSAKITSSENKAAFRSERFDVTAGAAFNLSIDIFDNEDGKLRVYLYFRNECGEEIWSSSIKTADSTNWNTISFTDTIPADAVAADIKVKVYDDNENPFYMDNVLYTENGGDNLFVNSGFEEWADLATPSINCDQQVASDKTGSYIVASSNAGAGKIYLVNGSVSITTKADLEAAEIAGDAVSENISSANTDVEILTEGLELGQYFCYSVDGVDSVSNKSRSCVEIAFAYDFLPEFWPIYETGVTISREKVIVKERTTSLKVTSSENKAAFRSGRFDVTPGAAFTLSMDILDNEDGKLRAYFYFRDACGEEIWSESIKTADSTDWNTITFTDTVPADAVAADIKFKVYDDNENPFYLDNVLYTENGGDNLFPNSYFEYWENVTTPLVNCDMQTVEATTGSVATASSNASSGYIYLIERDMAASTIEELDSAVAIGLGAKAEITTGNTEISTTGLTESIYFAYAVDSYGSVSNKSNSCITVVSSYGYLPEFWTVFDKEVTLSKEKTIVLERTSSLKVTTTEKKAAFRSGSFAVTPGEEYTFSINVMDTTSESKLRCYLYFRDACGNEILSSSQYSIDSTEWTPIVFNDTVPEDAVSADVKFKVYDKVGHALFVDKASYIEGEGENILPNQYFEFWTDIVVPWLRNDSETLTNGPDVTMSYSTNASEGTVYLFADTITEYTASTLEALVADQKATKADVSDGDVPTLDLVPGAYKLIIVDGSGYLSEEFTSCIDIIEWDNTPPIVKAEVQTATTAAGQFVLAQSNELGTVYIILDGEPASRVAELEAAVLAGKGSKAAVTSVDTDMEILTDSIMMGAYFAYAVDEQFNISDKGENQITISYPVGIKSFDELGMKVYPNPVKDVLNISQAQQIASYEVINAAGKLMMKSANQNSIVQINTSGYSVGMYMLKVYLNDCSYSKIKFVKQ